MKSLYGMDFSDEAYVKSTLIKMVLFHILYVISYKVLRRKLGENFTSEYSCRTVTFFHGIICCWLALYYIVLPSLQHYQVSSIPSQLILTHSMGYFIFDLFWCFIHGETAVMKFHHLLTVVGLFYYSFKLSKHYYIVYALGLTEITNPFLQVRWFLKHHGMREGIAFKLVEGMLIIMFFVIRVLVLSYYLYQGYTNKDLGFTLDDLIFTTLGALTGYALSYQMFNYIIYQFKKSQKKKLMKDQQKEQ